MCLADVRYIECEGAEARVVLDRVCKLRVEGDCIKVWNLFGEMLELNGRVAEVDFQKSIVEVVALDAAS